MTAIIHKSVSLVILYLMVIQAVKVKEDSQLELLTKDFCDISEFTDLDYYLFCNTELHKDVSGFEYKQAIIDNETRNINEAKELYQKFRENLSPDDSWETAYVEYVSPDCRWAMVTDWGDIYSGNTARKQTLFYEKKKVLECEVPMYDTGYNSFVIVKNGDTYERLDKEYYEKYRELKSESFSEGFYGRLILNEEGNLAAGVKKYVELVVKRIDNGTVLWSFSLDEIQNAVRKKRAGEQEDAGCFADVIQFVGDEEEGNIILQGEDSFFQIAYPSNEVTYLGECMYSLSYSPDGKYAAYSSVDYDNGVDMEPEEADRIAPGIYILEVETGRVAYLYWDPNTEPDEEFMERRSFLWIEKEGFERYMDG